MLNCIAESAVLGKDCEIGNFVTVGENCVLGEHVVLHNNVTLYPGTKVGDYTEIFDGAVIGRPPKSSGATVHKIPNSFRPTSIGAYCVIGANSVIYAQIKIGNHVLIGDGASLREGAVLGDYVLVAMNCTFNHDVTVGEHSKILDLCHITANTVVENSVFIGANVISANDNAMRLKGQEVGTGVRIHVKTGSRVGSAAMLLPGITVGEDALVASGSVVTKDVVANTRVMGIPAKEK